MDLMRYFRQVVLMSLSFIFLLIGVSKNTFAGRLSFEQIGMLAMKGKGARIYIHLIERRSNTLKWVEATFLSMESANDNHNGVISVSIDNSIYTFPISFLYDGTVSLEIPSEPGQTQKRLGQTQSSGSPRLSTTKILNINKKTYTPNALVSSPFQGDTSSAIVSTPNRNQSVCPPFQSDSDSDKVFNDTLDEELELTGTRVHTKMWVPPVKKQSNLSPVVPVVKGTEEHNHSSIKPQVDPAGNSVYDTYISTSISDSQLIPNNKSDSP